MDKLQCTCLMLCCLALSSVHGEDEGLFSSCKAKLMVPRGTAWKTLPHNPLTAQCPVTHCGQSLNVTWCKLSSQDLCEPINNTEAVEVTQIYTREELTSYLNFKAISVSDDGLYRCYLKGAKESHISHTINISVSDLNQGTEYLHSLVYAVEPLNAAARGGSWLPYFFICFSVALLVTLLTVTTHLSFHGWKHKLSCSPTHGQATSSCMIPGLPKSSDPTSPVLQAHFPVLTHVDCPRGSGTRPAPPSTTPPRTQPLASATHGREKADCETYAVINHKQQLPGCPARKLQTETNKPQYSTISVS